MGFKPKQKYGGAQDNIPEIFQAGLLQPQAEQFAALMSTWFIATRDDLHLKDCCFLYRYGGICDKSEN